MPVRPPSERHQLNPFSVALRPGRSHPPHRLDEQHRVHHVGALGALEDQICDYVPFLSKSPDRMDAPVWALTEFSRDREQEVIYEYSDIRPISPELDDFPDFSAFSNGTLRPIPHCSGERLLEWWTAR